MDEKKDFFLNYALNSEYSPEELFTMGYTPSTSTIKDKNEYLSDKRIQEQFKAEDGSFDQAKFDAAYENALAAFSYASTKSERELGTIELGYSADNFFVGPKKRMLNFEPKIIKMANPSRQTYSHIRLGAMDAPQFSEDEIAQTQKVWDEKTQSWHDSPNDSWFTDFWDTRVLAQYDEAGEHKDPITGKMVHHEAGELKLNDEGTYYYENLNGRSIYGRRVLNKLNTLTTDGSWWNKYDFFDSDGIGQKKIIGTIVKDAVLIGSMFLPYIGPAIAGLSMGSQLVGMAATVGKFFLGKDNAFLSQVEGWTQSINRQGLKTKYDSEHTFSLTNFIDVTADLMAQLKEQRFLFEYLPLLSKGTKLYANTWGKSESAAKALNKEIQDKFLAELTAKHKAVLQQSLKTRLAQKGYKTPEDFAKAMQSAEITAKQKAQAELAEYLSQYQKIGEVASKAYMAGLISHQIYGEAILAGVGENEASLLTLGRFAAEMALLNTPVGNYILPELRAGSKMRTRSAIETLASNKESIFNEVKAGAQAVGNSPDAKKNWAEKVIGLGTKLFDKAGESAVKKTFASTFAQGLETGIVNDIEEFLSDMTRQLHNTKAWILGEEGTQMDAWSNMVDRYGMGMASGLVGGTLTGLHTNYKMVEQSDISTYDQAWLELIYMARNGNINDFYKELDNVRLGNKDLSAKDYSIDSETNEIIWHAAKNYEDSLDYAIKQVIKQQVSQIFNIMETNGCKISDSSFLDANTLREMKWNVLQNTPAASRLLQRFNTVCVELAKTERAIADTSKQLTDKQAKNSNDPETQAVQSRLSELLAKRKDLLQEVEDLKTGKNAVTFMREAYAYLSPRITKEFVPINFQAFVSVMTGKDFKDVDQQTLEILKEKYENYKNTDSKDHMAAFTELLNAAGTAIAPTIQLSLAEYKAAANDPTMSVLNQVWNNFNIGNQVNQAQARALDSWTPDEWQDAIAKITKQQVVSFAVDYSTRKDALTNSPTAVVNGLVQFDPAMASPRTRRLYDLIDTLKLALEANDADAFNAAADETTRLSIEITKEALNDMMSLYTKLGWANPVIKQNMKVLAELLADNCQNNIDTNALTIMQAIKNNYLDELYDIFDYDDLQKLADMDEAEFVNSGIGVKTDLDIIKDVRNSLKANLDAIKQQTTEKQDYMLIMDEIDNLRTSPIYETLEHLSTSVLGESVNIQKLLQDLKSAFNQAVKTDVADFNLNQEDFAAKIENAISICKLYRSLLEAAEVNSLNIDSFVGYNQLQNEVAKKTGVENWVPLLEIESEDTAVLLNELLQVEAELGWYKLLNAVNQSQKLNKQNKVAVVKDVLFHNRTKMWLDTLKNDGTTYEGLDDLENAINAATKVSDLANTHRTSLSKDEREQVFKEMLQIQDALYDFYQLNKDKVRQMLHPDKINLLDDSSELLTEESTNINDLNFAWWLGARFAVKASQFYSEYKDVIEVKDTVIAPIATQELGIYLNYASVMNGNVLSSILTDLREGFFEDYAKLTPAERASKYKSPRYEFVDVKLARTLIPLPQYTNIVFTEGVPGSGKSTGVFKTVLKMLLKHHPDCPALKKIRIIHGTNNLSSAEKLLESFEIPNTLDAKVESVESFMQNICPTYTKPKFDPATGLYNMAKDLFTMDADGNIVCNTPVVNLATDTYSLVIIDEVTNLTGYELRLIDNYCKQNGLTCLTAGDLSQTGAIGNVTIDSFVPPKDARGEALCDNNLKMSLLREHVMHSPKLGVSMRSANIQKDSNNKVAAAWMEQYALNKALNQAPPPSVPLRYYYKDGKLFGDLAIQTGRRDPAGTETVLEYFDHVYEKTGSTYRLLEKDSKLVKAIEAMINNLKPGEKLGYIGWTESSPLYQYLVNNYKDKIETYINQSSQGLEGDYYIVELRDPKHSFSDSKIEPATEASNREKYVHDLYTGMTRAKEGTIIINPDETVIKPVKLNAIETDSEETTLIESYNEVALERYAKGVYDVLTNVLTSAETVTYTPRSTTATPAPVASGGSSTITPQATPLQTPAAPNPQATPPNNPGPQTPQANPAITPPSTPPFTPAAGGASGPAAKTQEQLRNEKQEEANKVSKWINDSLAVKPGDEIYILSPRGTLDPDSSNSLEWLKLDIRYVVSPDGVQVDCHLTDLNGNGLGTYSVPLDEFLKLIGKYISQNNFSCVITKQIPNLEEILKKYKTELNDLYTRNLNDALNGSSVWSHDLEKYVLETCKLELTFSQAISIADIIRSKISLVLSEPSTITVTTIEDVYDNLAVDNSQTVFTATKPMIGALPFLVQTNAMDTMRSTLSPDLGRDLEKIIIEKMVLQQDGAHIYGTIQNTPVEVVCPHELCVKYDPESQNEQAADPEDIKQQNEQRDDRAPAIPTPVISNNIDITPRLLYTFNTFETGLSDATINKINGGQITIQDIDQTRIDSLNGLILWPLQDKRITNPSFNYGYMLDCLQGLRHLAYNATDHAKLNKDITDLLAGYGFDATKVDFRFVLETHPLSYTQSKFCPRLDKKYDTEHILGQDSGAVDSNKMASTSISIIIANNGIDLLELPIFTFENPYTIAQSKDAKGNLYYPDLSSIVSWALNKNAGSMYKAVQDIISAALYYNLTLKYKTILSLFELYAINTMCVLPIDSNWMPGNMDSFGPHIVSGDKNIEAIVKGSTTIPTIDLKVAKDQSRMNVSPVYEVLNGDITLPDGRVFKGVFDVGVPFVFYSDDRAMTPGDMIELYCKLLQDPSLRKTVNCVNVVPPATSIKEYVQTLHSVMTGTNSGLKPYGTITQAFNILLAMLYNPKNTAFLDHLMAHRADYNITQDQLDRFLEVMNTWFNAVNDVKSDSNSDKATKGKKVAEIMRKQLDISEFIPLVVPSGKSNNIVSFYQFCLNVLQSLCHTGKTDMTSGKTDWTFLDSVVDLIVQVYGKDKVYYQPSIGAQMTSTSYLGGALKLYTVSNGTNVIIPGSGNNLLYQLNCKLDPPSLSGDISVIFDSIDLEPGWQTAGHRGGKKLFINKLKLPQSDTWFLNAYLGRSLVATANNTGKINLTPQPNQAPVLPNVSPSNGLTLGTTLPAPLNPLVLPSLEISQEAKIKITLLTNLISSKKELNFLSTLVNINGQMTTFEELIKEDIKNQPDREFFDHFTKEIVQLIFETTGNSIITSSNGVFVFPPKITQYTGNLANWKGEPIQLDTFSAQFKDQDTVEISITLGNVFLDEDILKMVPGLDATSDDILAISAVSDALLSEEVKEKFKDKMGWAEPLFRARSLQELASAMNDALKDDGFTSREEMQDIVADFLSEDLSEILANKSVNLTLEQKLAFTNALNSLLEVNQDDLQKLSEQKNTCSSLPSIFKKIIFYSF